MTDASKWSPSNPSRVTLSEEQGDLARAILGKQVHSAEDVRAAVGKLVNAWNEHGSASGVSMRHNFR